MNKKHFITMSLLCLMSLTVAAESNLGANCFAIWANGGIANYIGKTPGAKAALGYGGSLGFGYEWRDQTLLVQTGVGIRYTQTGLNADNRVYTLYNQYDSEGHLMDYQYIETNRRDVYKQATIQVPIMVGAHVSGFYFLAGVKANIYAYNQSDIKGNYAAQGVYDILIDPLANMDNHLYYTNREITSSRKYGMKFNVALSAELGGEFRLGESAGGNVSYMRIGAFADFNVLDDRTTSNNAMLEYPPSFNNTDMISVLKQNDYLHSTAAENPLRQLYAGVKLTFLISSGVKYGCVMCEGGYPSARDRRRGSRLQR